MENLILYSNNCPKCKVLKSKLDSKNISYTENPNLEELIPMGIKSLPVLMCNQQIMDFPTANTWVNKQEAR